jgi:predicted ATPase
VTGAPGSGKSTVLNRLSREGYEVVGDPARQLIESQLSLGFETKDTRRDMERFRANVFLRMIEAADSHAADQLVFFDYGLPDNVAFYKFANIATPSEVARAASCFRYRGVFLLEPLPLRPDIVRVENKDEQMKLQSLISEAYKCYSYSPVSIPRAPSFSRARQIVTAVKR